MNQQHSRNQDVPNRESNMEPAEGARETVEQGRGSQGERNSSKSGSSNAGGITNRPLDREECEQQQLPERGKSQSER